MKEEIQKDLAVPLGGCRDPAGGSTSFYKAKIALLSCVFVSLLIFALILIIIYYSPLNSTSINFIPTTSPAPFLFKPTHRLALSLKTPNNLPKDLLNKLNHIKNLSTTAGLPESRSSWNICYDEDCLDASIDLLSALDMTNDPCKKFYKFACGRWSQNNLVPETFSLIKIAPWNQLMKIQLETINFMLGHLREPIGNSTSDPFYLKKKMFQDCVDESDTSSFEDEVDCSVLISHLSVPDLMDRYIAISKPEVRKAVIKLVPNIIQAFDDLLKETYWMSPETKRAVLDKLKATKYIIGYPDGAERGVESYLEIDGEYQKAWESFLNVMGFAGQMAANMLGHNAIYIPLNMLQPPLIGRRRPTHQIYAGIGIVIAHELSHGLGGNGTRFDKDGNDNYSMIDETSREEYERRRKCFEEQYGNYLDELTGQNINESLTIEENIADNVALIVSFRAYMSYLRNFKVEEELPGLSYFTEEQLFFLRFANVWCESVTPDVLLNVIKNNTHAPREISVNGALRNFPEFGKAFN